MKLNQLFSGALAALFLAGCQSGTMKESTEEPTDDGKIRIMTLEPGHFHAGLIHKSMYPVVDSTIYVFAPDGPELTDYLARINGYNTRAENPTGWKTEVTKGPDFLQKMIDQKPGNVMVVAGKNDHKVDYVLKAIENDINVYADKPLVVDKAGYAKLLRAFQVAEQKDLLLYDIMTERFEITTILQRQLSMMPEVFGELEDGTPDNPAITKESVHHFFKYVSGKPLVRPDWFFDVKVEGTGIVDVTTHLVDLVQWETFPEQMLDTTDVNMMSAKLWPTVLTLDDFKGVTGTEEFPAFLSEYIKDGKLEVLSNGEMNYTLRGKHAKVSVIWNYKAPEGAADTHYSMMRGTKANLMIRQGAEENYRATLYVKLLGTQDEALAKAINETLQAKYPGIGLTKQEGGEYIVDIPDSYHNGHEAHFGQVTEKFLEYYQAGSMPEWEKAFMKVKYFTNIKALEMATAK
ncbi:MAG: putative oxidoreductase C-terminal domain-containing protein [Imperialibacter sp.]|uniref:putative oxidoreductase C-terminal domain-containing protein n=1 Tax=Imperialibacter sp. TaxID=2038411 RepID=UPI003A856D18